ncbi:TonB-dependent receptor [Thalassotalea euphylliae]|uniref:TonB-dependent receptor n=1 Tax=Thalassotalea euphylliae TaxID=1655234 RepID=A0A3E0TUZ6_9GAMM|nr:TonB-dependent receptor [Thalassotalea euphylliae]REL28193.1 TonB-dependent receptor [Thalassotalea euphylliae]
MNNSQHFAFKPNAKLLALCIAAALLTTTASAVNAEDDLAGIERVMVIGKSTEAPAANLVGSYEIIGRDQLDYLRVDDNVELFTKLPGVSISRYNQGPINADLSIRGFDGDGTTPHAKLLIDGIPQNLHNGFGELDQLFSLNIDSIQAFKGISDVRYGLYNLAGNYNVFSRKDTGVATIDATVGSFDTRELQGYTGIESGKLTHNYAFGYRESEGYRDNTDLERYAGSGRWFYELDANTTIGYILRYSHFDADAPGYLTKEESRRSPRSSASYASEDGGDKTVFHNSLHLDTSIDKLDISAKAYFQTFERERWVRFSEGGSLGNRYDDQEQLGFILDTVYSFNDDWSLLTGLSYQQEDVIEQRFGTIGQRRVRDTNNVVRDFDYTLDTTGVYASVEHQVNEQLSITAGVRADKLDGDFTATSSDGTQSPRDIFDFDWIVQPKLNVFYQATDNFALFFNYGESFQHPFGSSLYTSGDTNARDVSTNKGYELGTKVSLGDTADVRLSLWQQDAEDEFISVDGISQNVGETERKGWELALTWAATDIIDIWANYSSVDTEIVKTSTAAAATQGNELRSIPEYTASIGIDAQITEQITASVHVDSQGDYYVNEANLGGQFGDYTITNASIDYEFDWGLVSLNANNLFDEYYEYVFDFSSDGTATIHSPADGRNYSLSIRYSF